MIKTKKVAQLKNFLGDSELLDYPLKLKSLRFRTENKKWIQKVQEDDVILCTKVDGMEQEIAFSTNNYGYFVLQETNMWMPEFIFQVQMIDQFLWFCK